MEHVYNVYNSIYRYFSALEQMGHYDRSETINLIIYLFIVNEVFNGRLNEHLDDEGLALFEKALRCLYNGCLIDPVNNNNYLKEAQLYANNTTIRHSEVFVPRVSDVHVIRTPEARD